MKFTRTIIFSLVSVLSVGSLVTFAESNNTAVDRKFTFEDKSGNRDVLNQIGIESIIKVDSNSFEKVILKDNKVQFEKTDFDLRKQVGEKVLNNKELYRGYEYAQSYESNSFLMTACFNPKFPYASNDAFIRIAKKDKKTKRVIKKEIPVSNITLNQQISSESIFELQNNMYYSLVVSDYSSTNSKNTLKVYEINKDSLGIKEVLSKELSLPGDYTDASSIVSDGKQMYILFFNDKEYKLFAYDPKMNKENVKDFPLIMTEDRSIQMVNVDNQYFYVNQGGSIYMIDKNTNKLFRNDGMKASILENYQYSYPLEQKIMDDKIYVLYRGYKDNNTDDSLIVVYNKQNGKVMYEGKLPSLNNRGVGVDYSFSK